jgi:hypothetical protein
MVLVFIVVKNKLPVSLMNFQTQKLLPAVLMSISSVSAISATAHTAMAASVNINQHAHGVPAVLINQPDTNVQTPEKLSSYERALAEKTDFPAKRDCRADANSESQSFSGGRVQTDDSRSDCFR